MNSLSREEVALKAMQKNYIKTEALIQNLGQVLLAVDTQLIAAHCPLKVKMQIDIAVEELFVNIAHYAYAPDTGDAEILIETAQTCPIPEDQRENIPGSAIDGSWIMITLSDSGKPFNPLKKADPDISLPAQERSIGGLGIFMVKKSMDHISYEYKDGKNHISICKKLT